MAEGTFGDLLEEMQRSLKIGGESRPLKLLDTHQRPQPEEKEAKFGRGAVRKPKPEPRSLRPSSMSVAAVALRSAGIIKLEGRKAHRPSKIRLNVGDGEIRLAFKDDPDIKEVGSRCKGIGRSTASRMRDDTHKIDVENAS